MKQQYPIVRLAFVLIIVSYVAACTPRMPFQTSEVVPAARGYVSVKKDKNSNFAIEVHIANLAEVGRLQPPKASYVIWMEGDGQTTKNIGQLLSTEKMFNKSLKASFVTVSTIRPSRIFITAEADGNVQYPGTMVILTTNDF